MPARYTPSFAKNIIRRSLKVLLDKNPTPAQIASMWEHFSDRCAFCGVSLPAGHSDRRLDHLVSDGTNHISNRVPACARCNDQEKRDSAWETFLRKKAGDQFEERNTRILDWIAKTSPGGEETKNPSEAIARTVEAVVTVDDLAVAQIRRSRESEV